MRVYDFKLFNAADLSQASLTSSVCDLDSMYGYSIQAVFSGDAIGTLSIQASNDPFPVTDLTIGRIVNYTTVSTLPLTAPGSVLDNIDAAHYKWVRLIYTKTSGSGSITANLHAKGV